MTLGALGRNATLKTTKRFAFWATLLLFTGFVSILYGGQYYQGRMQKVAGVLFALPDGWQRILTGPVILPMIFGSAILILLVSSEFMWRTARQNVIDGLSKEQVFVEKLLLVPALVVLFFGIYLLIGGGLAWAGTDRATMVGPWIRGPELALMGGAALACLGYVSTALFAALAIRNPGSAIGVWLVYAVVLERLLISGLSGISPKLAPILRFLPFNVFTHLTSRAEYDPEAYRRAVEQAARFGTTPDVWGRGLHAAAVAWIVLFLGSAFLWFRKRDL